MSKGYLLLLIVGLSLFVCPTLAADKVLVDHGYVKNIAEGLAKKPYESRRGEIPESFKTLDYDRYRRIQFRQELGLWGGENLNYQAHFFPPGYLYTLPVQMNEFTVTHSQRIRFVTDFFNFDGVVPEAEIPTSTGYAGFKLLFPLNPEKKGGYDEVASFVGASYFRMLGKGQRYGLSARGLAINTGIPGVREEFPDFVEFWLGKPVGKSPGIIVHALLDSPSVAGAYTFRIIPGVSTKADVEVTLFFRNKVQSLGLAPLTSMFWFGENSERRFNDYREEVHDSDGLLLRTGAGKLLWRPLVNGNHLRNSAFQETNVRGFGLMQRDRDFEHYQDMANPYHRTPSLFVSPLGDWGKGEVRLVEIATASEALDNVVVFWEPEKKPEPGKEFHYSYQMDWTLENELELSKNRVIATRVGEVVGAPGQRWIAVDFSGEALAKLKKTGDVSPETESSPPGKVIETRCFPNPHTGGWRVMIKAKTGDSDPSGILFKCTLKREGKPLTETWDYLWIP